MELAWTDLPTCLSSSALSLLPSWTWCSGGARAWLLPAAGVAAAAAAPKCCMAVLSLAVLTGFVSYHFGRLPSIPIPSCSMAAAIHTRRRMGVQHVVIAGVQTPNCIRGTAWDALALDYPRVTVLADATASRSEAVQAANLEDMRCASVLTPTVAEWAAQL